MATSTDVLKLDFGPTIPVKITPEARKWMTRLAKVGLVPVLEAVTIWARSQPVKAVAAFEYVDYEYPDWRELWIEIQLDIEEFDPLWQLMDELVDVEQGVLNSLPPKQREAIKNGLMVHLLWADDSLSVSSTSSIRPT